MFRCKLRTLLIILAFGPPILWGAFWLWQWAIAYHPQEGEIIYDEWITYPDGTTTRWPPTKMP